MTTLESLTKAVAQASIESVSQIEGSDLSWGCSEKARYQVSKKTLKKSCQIKREPASWGAKKSRLDCDPESIRGESSRAREASSRPIRKEVGQTDRDSERGHYRARRSRDSESKDHGIYVVVKENDGAARADSDARSRKLLSHSDD